MNNCIVRLKEILNWEIDDEDILSGEELKNKRTEFRESISYEKYRDLFNDINNCLLNDTLSVEEKNEMIGLFLELIIRYEKLKSNIDKFPKEISMLYKNHDDFNKLGVLFEMIENAEFCASNPYKDAVLQFIDFLDNPKYEFYVHNYYKEIDNYSNKLLNYLNNIDYEGREFKTMIDPEVIEILKAKISVLTRER